jgi:hypothetical protein
LHHPSPGDLAGWFHPQPSSRVFPPNLAMSHPTCVAEVVSLLGLHHTTERGTYPFPATRSGASLDRAPTISSSSRRAAFEVCSPP